MLLRPKLEQHTKPSQLKHAKWHVAQYIQDTIHAGVRQLDRAAAVPVLPAGVTAFAACIVHSGLWGGTVNRAAKQTTASVDRYALCQWRNALAWCSE